MASLYRLDVIIRGNSDISQDDAIKWTKNWVNERQEDEANKNDDETYKREFYADLYDSRTNKGWKIFSDVATKSRSIENEYKTKNNEIIKGVIYTLPFNDDVVLLKEELKKMQIEITFLKAEIYSKVASSSELNVKIIV